MTAWQRRPDDGSAPVWPVVFIDPEPPGGSRKSRHPVRWGIIIGLLGIALAVGPMFVGRPTVPADDASVRAPPPDPNGSAGRAVAGLTTPQRVAPPPPPTVATDPQAQPPAIDPPPTRAAPRVRRFAPRTEVARPTEVTPRNEILPATESEPRPSTIAHLSLNSYPWGVVTVDDNPVGNTPMVSLPVLPGTHHIRIEHAGYVPYDQVVRVEPGQVLRLTGIVLQAANP